MSGSVTQAAASTSTAASGTAGNALQSLSGNFTNFLQLLMTQLKNQDPTSPLDANQFTTELVQFTGVEQQIATNSSLSTLISQGQSAQLLQTAGMVGHSVTVTADKLALQNGSGGLQFTAPAAGPVTITVANTAGRTIAQSTVAATAGTNNWTWNGADLSGATLPDGAYKVTVATKPASGAGVAVPFAVVGIATGAQMSGTTPQLQLGALSVPLSSVRSVGQ